MKKKIIIISDSTSDLNDELIKRYDVRISPLGIVLSDRRYLDGVDIKPNDIYKRYEETGELPKTSAINTYDLTEFFRKNKEDGDEIIFFTISSDLSSTYQNAVMAASEFEGVYVVDSRNLSNGVGMLVIMAAEMAEKGDMTAAEIAKECEQLAKRADMTFVVDSLEFLRKGGRCSAVTEIAATYLKIKPCITVRKGKMQVGHKYRGKFEAVIKKYLADRLSDLSDIELDKVFVVHAGCDETLYNECVELVKELAPFKEVYRTDAGCTIASHCGRNTLGIMYLRKTEL